MNFLHGRLKEAGSAMVFKESNGGVIECPVTNVSGLKAYAGKDVVMGIRPEKIECVAPGSAQVAYRFQAVVDLVEPTGAETNFHLQTGAHTIICRSASAVDHSEADGHRFLFELDPANIQFFDMETTNRIR